MCLRTVKRGRRSKMRSCRVVCVDLHIPLSKLADEKMQLMALILTSTGSMDDHEGPRPRSAQTVHEEHVPCMRSTGRAIEPLEVPEHDRQHNAQAVHGHGAWVVPASNMKTLSMAVARVTTARYDLL
ncbi:hypothetical protein AKJ16_DCAP15834 [Drosera capensis]